MLSLINSVLDAEGSADEIVSGTVTIEHLVHSLALPECEVG